MMPVKKLQRALQIMRPLLDVKSTWGSEVILFNHNMCLWILHFTQSCILVVKLRSSINEDIQAVLPFAPFSQVLKTGSVLHSCEKQLYIDGVPLRYDCRKELPFDNLSELLAEIGLIEPDSSLTLRSVSTIQKASKAGSAFLNKGIFLKTGWLVHYADTHFSLLQVPGLNVECDGGIELPIKLLDILRSSGSEKACINYVKFPEESEGLPVLFERGKTYASIEIRDVKCFFPLSAVAKPELIEEDLSQILVCEFSTFPAQTFQEYLWKNPIGPAKEPLLKLAFQEPGVIIKHDERRSIITGDRLILGEVTNEMISKSMVVSQHVFERSVQLLHGQMLLVRIHGNGLIVTDEYKEELFIIKSFKESGLEGAA